MRLARLGEPGSERPAVADEEGRWHDLTPVAADIDPAFLAAVPDVDVAGLPVVEPGRFGPPVAGIGKVVCIGLNYRDHAAETGAAIPDEPIIFFKGAGRWWGLMTRCWCRGVRPRPITRSSWPW